MKPFATLFIIALFSAINMNAQTYTEHIQKKVQGQGTVTVNQSKEIDELVNGKAQTQPNTSAKKTPSKPAAAEQTHATKKTETKPTTTTQNNVTKKAENKPEIAEQHNTTKNEKDSAKKEETAKHETPAPKKVEENADDNDGMDIPVVDLRKKVMRKSYKVTGYRVQAFAGGNSRQDKIKAQQIGNNIKMQFPEEPIYVHFYSPRWICRVGNYRSYEEAHRMLTQIHKMGYKSASIVRGKITVQY